MPNLTANMTQFIGGFQIQGLMMRYNLFVPRLYDWCMSLGFEAAIKTMIDAEEVKVEL